MAKLFPSLENINRLKTKPEEGELFLINYLVENLAENDEIYFQPFLNGDRPDVIVVRKNVGVLIIEVKDWNPSSYHIDAENNWLLEKNGTRIRSPLQQVFAYKHNLFNLHINGLLEKKIKNNNFYNIIKPYVYFHNASKLDIEYLFDEAISHYKNELENNNNAFNNKEMKYDAYEKRRKYLNEKKSKFERDKNQNAVTNDRLHKISFSKIPKSGLFEDSIYEEFQRYLQPPHHTKNEGIEIIYEKKQAQLIESKPVHQKIKGVAGCGKTAVLAKRAVNAHKRHGDNVLILTFNLTLRNYIRDRISDVREDFSWGNFYITNYHQLITQTSNNLNLEIDLSKDLFKQNRFELLDKLLYSNVNVFDAESLNIPKYKSIFIDEIQDYKPEWIKIIREYFLEENGEMVLFGDEKQNIYERDIDNEKNTTTVQGFGRWQQLNKTIRQKENSPVLELAKNFQQYFFDGKYEIDNYEVPALESQQTQLDLGLYKISNFLRDDLRGMVSVIFENIRKEKTHPNDVCILSSNLDILREVDYLIRREFNEKTLTTFETKELSESKLQYEIEKVRKIKKIGFNLNSGVLKISTIHSFKGFESPTVFLIIDEHDNEEIIYTAITRAKFNLMIFTLETSKYNNFFYSVLEKESPRLKALEADNLMTG